MVTFFLAAASVVCGLAYFAASDKKINHAWVLALLCFALFAASLGALSQAGRSSNPAAWLNAREVSPP